MRKLIDKLLRRKPMGTVKIRATVVRADGTREDLGVVATGKVQLNGKAGA